MGECTQEDLALFDMVVAESRPKDVSGLKKIPAATLRTKPIGVQSIGPLHTGSVPRGSPPISLGSPHYASWRLPSSFSRLYLCFEKIVFYEKY